jgi:MYXO-CTERM domain-containing protein
MNEAGMSRIYGGIHWQFDNVGGLAAGTGIGNWVFGNALAVPTPGAAGVLAAAGLVALRRRRK